MKPARWRRVVVKVGTSSLTNADGHIEPSKVRGVAAGALALARAGAGGAAKLVIVSSGAGAAGRERLGLKLPLTLPEKQAAAAVGQVLLMQVWSEALAPTPMAQLLLSAGDIQERERYVNAKNALEASLALGVIPVINENDSVATAEIKVGDNDTLSAWVSYLVGADVLVILTDVDGLYDVDPRKSDGAKRIDVVDDIGAVQHLAGAAGSSRGTGGMATKLRAARIASAAGIETIVLGGGGAGLAALAEGEQRGTRFLASRHVPARKAWISNQPRRGVVAIDAGAAKALTAGKSLLPKGIVSVDGAFTFGDAVEVRLDGTLIAVGLTNYGSESLARIVGRHTSEIAAVLGTKDYDEAVHRDNLALVSTQGTGGSRQQSSEGEVRAGDSMDDA